MLGALAVKPKGLGVGEIADMLADEGLPPAGQRQGRLEMAAAGQNVGAVLAEVDRFGDEAARAAQKGRRAVDDLHHAVVGAHDNVAVMGHDQIGDRREFLLRFLVASDERRAARVGRSRDEDEVLRLIARAAGRMEQQMVDRRIGQHHAEPRHVRRHRLGQVFQALDQHDRMGGTAQHGEFIGLRTREKRDRGLVGDHDGEWFCFAVFPQAQARDRFGVGRVAQQMEPADSLQRDDLSFAQRRDDFLPIM